MAAHRIPSLDGLRAISIALVLVLHVSNTNNFFTSAQVSVINPGDLGVRVFFVISGFLITTLLLNELEVTGRVSVRDFYIRRIFRIFPAFYAYVAVILTLWFADIVTLSGRDMWHALTYTVNYHHHDRGWLVSHLWSLSVEEQFYLLWPATLALLGRRRGLLITGGVLVLVPLVRLVLWQFVLDYRPYVLQSFETVADALATGCLLAGLRGWLWNQRWYSSMLSSRWFVAVPLIILVGDALYIKPRLYFAFFLPMVNISIALMIDWCVRNPFGVIGRVLNSRPFVGIGVLSYSLYLWQQLFCQQQRHPATWWGQFPVNIALSLATATLSYFLIEQPFLNLRKRFSRGTSAVQIAAGAQAAP